MTDTDALLPALDTEVDILHHRLVARAGAQDLLDITYRELDSPIGGLLIAATERGLVRVAFAGEGDDAVRGAPAARASPRILRSSAGLEQPARELAEYFAGTRTVFESPVDHALSSGFRGDVQRYLARIPYGATASYGQVATAVGNPRAVRAVGSACATNPLPIIQPCHRVLRGDGSLGGYLGGLSAKRALLALESPQAALG